MLGDLRVTLPQTTDGFSCHQSDSAAHICLLPACPHSSHPPCPYIPSPSLDPPTGQKYDLVLTSGILSFTEHTAFLEAVEEAGLKVHGPHISSNETISAEGPC
jgi:hypothetical protein